jgi:hypothetical protein
MYWDCQYNSLEDCVPNVLSGNRGFCNVNPAFGMYAAKPTGHHPKSIPFDVPRRNPEVQRIG